MPGRILIIEDEPAIREMVGIALRRAGYEMLEADDAEQAGSVLKAEIPDLILLDWMLPGMSGVDFARSLRKRPDTSQVPVIMLTARGEEEDRIRGLEVGADDYVTKPFSPRELIARIRAVLRRAAPLTGDEPIEIDGLCLDPACHRVTVQGHPLDLGPTEFRLLHYFMTHLERVYSRSQLLDYVWGTSVYIEERSVDVHIRRLRKGLSPYGYDQMVQTVRGAGYRFSRQV
jgi:phosphate regulon transcriptional regulatory protein PhoB